MLKVKEGVVFHKDTFKNMKIVAMLQGCQDTAPDGYCPTVTAAADGQHKEDSKHYSGRAFDLRIRDLDNLNIARQWLERLKIRLGSDYFCQIEGADTPGSSGAHIHMQYNGVS